MTKLKRKPTHPGEILHVEYLIPLGLTQKQLADHLNVNQKSSVTPKVALRLSCAFNTTLDFWLNAQSAVDLYEEKNSLKNPPRKLVGKSIYLDWRFSAPIYLFLSFSVLLCGRR